MNWRAIFRHAAGAVAAGLLAYSASGDIVHAVMTALGIGGYAATEKALKVPMGDTDEGRRLRGRGI